MEIDFFEKLHEHLEKNPDQIIFQEISEDRNSFTYRQVSREIRILSDFLRNKGVGPGFSVGILIENQPRWPIAFFAVQSCGATAVPLDILHTPKTLAKLITHSECCYLFSSEKLLPVVEEIQECLETRLPAVIVGESGGNYTNWEELVDSRSSDDIPLPLVRRDPDEPHIIMYTSGTTGDPKGVVLTGRNLYTNVVEALKRIDVVKEDNFLNVLPLYHILALSVNVIVAFYAGSRVTFLGVLDAQKIMKAFREEEISIFVCVPQFFYVLHRRIFQEVQKQSALKRFMFYRLLAVSRFANNRLGFNPGKKFFTAIHKQFGPRLRYIGVGGARFDLEVAKSLRDLGFNLVQAYGMTETAAFSTVTPVGKGVGSVGSVLPHVQIRIANPDPDGIGKVLIRGDNVMKGYLKNPSATAETIDPDGWLDSGDLGYLDDEGFLYITGRAKDVIVLSSGKNIYPEEIEHFYQENCPYIKEMCVLGITDESSENAQERLHAVVVPDWDLLRSEKVANAYDMIRYLMETISQKLPGYKRVHSLEIWKDPLPRTTTRKIKRFEVEKMYKGEAQQEQDDSTEETFWEPETPEEKQVVRLIKQVKKDAKVFPAASLEFDLGFDSLERVELISGIQENFGVDIEDEEAAEVLTVEEVIELISRKKADSAGEIGSGTKSWADILEEPLYQSDQELVYKRLRRRPFVEFLFVLVTKFALLKCKIFFRLKGYGLNNLPSDYPFMICPNHLSFLDAFVVAALMPARVIRRWFSLGYSDYVSEGLTGFLGGLVKTVPVDPDVKLRQALRLAAEGLRNRLVLCIFPEGERSIDGSLKTFKRGPAILAANMKVPVVPVGIKGSYEAWRRGSSKIRFHPIQVHFGKPIQAMDGETVEEFNDRLKREVAKLLD